MNQNHELKPAELRKKFSSTDIDLSVLKGAEEVGKIVGQDRAIAALRFGLDTAHQGFNIYVAGLPRTGKMTAVRAFVEKLATSKPTPSDWCYVHNFDDPYQPKALEFPAGQAKEFQQDVIKLMEKVHLGIPKAFESEAFAAKREAIVKALDDQRNERLDKLKLEVAEKGFSLQLTQHGVLLIPILKGKLITDEELQELPLDVLESIRKRRESIEGDVKKMMKTFRTMERSTEDQIQELEKQQILFFLGGIFEDLIEKYQQAPEVVNYLESLQKNILENRANFKNASAPGGGPFGFMLEEITQREYSVNVLITRLKDSGAPVVLEINPSYNELFGRLEKESHFGVLHSDFTLIKAGAIHRANGGYLVLQMEDVLRNPFSWEALKRAIRTRLIQIEDPAERYGFTSGKMARPQPIPLNMKVVLTGPALLYYLLSVYDSEFSELFKVQADFEDTMPQNQENLRGFLVFLRSFSDHEKILSLDVNAIIAILEYAVRLADDQEKFTTQFGVIADVLREADHWARLDSATEIKKEHIEKAVDQIRYRSSLLQERLMDRTIRGTILIDTDGAKEAQVNGLTIIALNHHMFGRPVRITASISPGREGIVDIEREVKLGGPLHSKGVLILGGYLSQKYSARQPLSLTAKLVFEQSYSGIEGDSASSAELCALLSALAGTPIEQGIAITGSINQHGRIQAIGGVNEKIEGFFDLCKTRGFNGNQGAIIPRSNVQNLMLKTEVIEAVNAGRFHVWAVDEIDEAMEILTGIPAGVRGDQNEFPAGTLNCRIQGKLSEFVQTMKELPAPAHA